MTCVIEKYMVYSIIRDINMDSVKQIWQMVGLRYKSHPWHGVYIGEDAPDIVTSYIEVTPTDTVKYEADKATGFLKVDRPQKYSNFFPALYGFVPQTFCGELVAEYCNLKTGRDDIDGDGDPIDICVLTEKNITHGDILVQAVPIGGFRMIDGGEADDKIIAKLKEDEVYARWQDISDVPETMISRLKHYFLTYKDMPGDESPRCQITDIYGKEEAQEVIRRARKDYMSTFGKLEQRLSVAVMEAFDLGKTLHPRKK